MQKPIKSPYESLLSKGIPIGKDKLEAICKIIGCDKVVVVAGFSDKGKDIQVAGVNFSPKILKRVFKGLSEDIPNADSIDEIEIEDSDDESD